MNTKDFALNNRFQLVFDQARCFGDAVATAQCHRQTQPRHNQTTCSLNALALPLVSIGTTGNGLLRVSRSNRADSASILANYPLQTRES